jgi:hypothetical protein
MKKNMQRWISFPGNRYTIREMCYTIHMYNNAPYNFQAVTGASPAGSPCLNGNYQYP